MTDLRTAAQQALEALKMMRDQYEEYACPACDHADAAIYALKAALAEPVQEPDDFDQLIAQTQADPEGAQALAGGRRWVKEQFYASAEPVQKPVAIVGTQADVWRGYDGKWAPPGPPIKTVHMLRDLPIGAVLYAAPPQRPAEPVQEPVGVVTSMVKGGVTWHQWPSDLPDGTPLYTAPPHHNPLSVTALQEALVETDLIDPDAIDDPDGYDGGMTLAQIDALHQRLTA